MQPRPAVARRPRRTPRPLVAPPHPLHGPGESIENGAEGRHRAFPVPAGDSFGLTALMMPTTALFFRPEVTLFFRPAPIPPETLHGTRAGDGSSPVIGQAAPVSPTAPSLSCSWDEGSPL